MSKQIKVYALYQEKGRTIFVEFLLEYFREHILYSEEDIERIQNLDAYALLEITAVSDFFSKRNR